MAFQLIKKESLGITKRLLKRDFSGDSGQAIKNSFFNLSTNIVAKIGSLIFTVILARMLMPELFGLYSLALSTIVVFAAFADLGLGTAIIKYLAKEKSSSSKYYHYFFKIKFILTIFICLLLIISSYFIANYYYQKPVFLALLAGSLYILIISLSNFYSSVFQARNNFKVYFIKEIIFQLARLILVPLAILFFISSAQSIVLFWIILSTSVSYLFALIYLFLKDDVPVKKEISKLEKKQVNLFLLPLSATILSGIFFGYVDIIILGRYVEPSFIGFYQAALALIGAAGVFVGFTSGALFPLFSKLRGKKLALLFEKAQRYTLFFSMIGIILAISLASLVVGLIYGADYSPAILLLKIFSIILIFDPLIAVYTSFYISQNRPFFVAKTLIFSTLLNIVLNYFFINLLIVQSHYMATIGAAIATIIAKGVHLSLLFFRKNLS